MTTIVTLQSIDNMVIATFNQTNGTMAATSTLSTSGNTIPAAFLPNPNLGFPPVWSAEGFVAGALHIVWMQVDFNGNVHCSFPGFGTFTSGSMAGFLRNWGGWEH